LSWFHEVSRARRRRTGCPARRRARATLAWVAKQNNYNLARRNDDTLIADLAREGIAYVPFFPLGGFSPQRSSVADRLGATPMQVALAWLRSWTGSPAR
jgi:aryl-alcohol dehydrogenase-like predicted oxidoreductase